MRGRENAAENDQAGQSQILKWIISNRNFSHATLTNRKLLTFQERVEEGRRGGRELLPAKLTVAGLTRGPADVNTVMTA